MTPKVSIVVPVYHVEPYLERCLETLIHQTLTEIEIILVDDGSKDRCSEICDAYAAKDNRILVIHKENEGPGLARNSGIEKATGEYIGFVDSDDYVSLEMFQTLYQVAVEENADVVLSGFCSVGGIMFSDNRKDKMRFLNCFSEKEYFVGRQGIGKLMLGTAGALPQDKTDSRYGFSVWKNIFRRSIIQQQQIRFVSERVYLSEDVIFLLDYFPHIQKAVGIPGAYYYYCRNENSVSKSFREDSFNKYLFLIGEMRRRLEVVVDAQQAQLFTDRLMIAAARVCVIQEIDYALKVKMPLSRLHRRLFDICSHAETTAVLRRYPFYRLPKMQAVFAFTMRYRLILFQEILVYLRRLI